MLEAGQLEPFGEIMQNELPWLRQVSSVKVTGVLYSASPAFLAILIGPIGVFRFRCFMSMLRFNRWLANGSLYEHSKHAVGIGFPPKPHSQHLFSKPSGLGP